MQKRYLREVQMILTLVGLFFIVIFLVIAGGYLPGSTSWSTVNKHLIMAIPYIFVIGIGVYLTVSFTGVFILLGCSMIGISFALLVDYLATNGIIDVTKSIGAFFGGSLNTIVTVIIISFLLLGIILSTRKRRIRW